MPDHPRDPIDVFVELFDRFTDRRRPHEPTWWAENGLLAGRSPKADQVRAMLTRTGRITPEFLLGCRDTTSRLAVLLAIDNLVGEVLNLPPDSVPRRMKYIRHRYLGSGRLDDDSELVLPRRDGYHGTRSEEGLYSLLQNIIRVPRRCSGRIRFVNAISDSDRIDPYRTGVGAKGITVGCVPFLDHPDELTFERIPRGGKYFYSIQPKPLLERRVYETLRRLDRSRCVVGVVPELALSKELLDAWKIAVTRPRPKQSRLRWVLAGTGAIAQSDARKAPGNTAALIDRNSGRVVALQDKRSPFNLQDEDIKKYGLVPKIGRGPIQEFLTEGTHLTVIETDFGRLGIYVCEDLAREDINMVDAQELGLTHLLIPVFSRPLVDFSANRWSWEVISADGYSEKLGICSVVSTSLVIHRAVSVSPAGSPIAPPVVTSVSFRPVEPRKAKPHFGMSEGDPTAVSVHPVSFRRAVS
jgi:hypothetical protein